MRANKLLLTSTLVAGLFCAPTFAQDHTKTASDDIVTTAVNAGNFGTLVAAVKAAGLVETLQGDGPFTVFAPTDEAFAKLPKATVAELLKPENKDQLTRILTYHVVAGRFPAKKVVSMSTLDAVSGDTIEISTENGVQIAGCNVVATDITCSNGVIHVIDTVMLPPKTPNIVELAQGAGTFQTLLAAAQAAGLVDALTGEGPLTVFAPTDEAFAALPEGTVESLLKPENKEQLKQILLFHVVAGAVDARSAVVAGNAETLQGQSVEFGIDNGRLTVQNANIIGTDLKASNGIVHVIDTVILPN
ncbi:MAG: fasciclin domain-containing protein [Planctomycetota bacterium]